MEMSVEISGSSSHRQVISSKSNPVACGGMCVVQCAPGDPKGAGRWQVSLEILHFSAQGK